MSSTVRWPNTSRRRLLRIETEDWIDRPADEIYPLVRDEMVKVLPHLPDVESVVQQSYERESETRVRIVNLWKAKGQIPGPASKFLPADILTWTDRALWKDDEYCVDFELEGFGYNATGTNFFEPHDGGTRLRVTADIVIHPEKFKIPSFVFKRVFPLVESSVEKAVKPNLTALARGLRSYFDSQQG
jgi:hypothetical protein